MVTRPDWKTPEELSIHADSEPYILSRDHSGPASKLAIQSALVTSTESSDVGIMTDEFPPDNQADQMSLDGGQHET